MSRRVLRALRDLRRATAVALATLPVALALLGQLTLIVHGITVRHERCLEHGELRDVRADAPQHSHRGDEAEQWESASIDSDEDDDHCALAALRTTTITPPPSLPSATATTLVSDVAVAAQQAPIPSRRPLDDAPKQGPPAQA